MSDVDITKLVEQEAAYLRKVHPTPDDIPSCISLLENYWQCHRIRTQFVSVYRYGQRVPCNAKMDDYMYCMSLKMMEPEEKYEAWIQRRALWWAKRRLAKSSEDVWAMREEPLKEYPKPIVEQAQTENVKALW
ncbi:hypothetical protein C8J56DRAFT_819894 [Mycena floridula]|nr:hypothetical protein C8J56DRAFT_819894 [Mycena floridula]